MPERDAIAEIRRGVALAICAVLCFTVMISLVKWLSGWFAPMQIAFFRAFCAMALCLPVLLADSGVAGLRTRQPWSYVLRGLVGCGSIATSFYGVTLVPIADWVALTFMVPLFVAAMSAPLLGESVGWRRWLAILVGFAGILIIVPPTGTASLWALTVGISSQLLVAFALVLIRRMGSGERTTTIVFYYMVGISVITLVLAPLDWRGPQGTQWLWLAAVGFIGGGAHLLITAAYRRAPASVIAPLDYTGIVWAMLIGWFVWHEKPDASLFLGVPLVIGSGLYVVINATRRRKQAGPHGSTSSP